ncbi:MAG: 3-hydroxyacyl-ACP dehydratase FabZ [bacterium]
MSPEINVKDFLPHRQPFLFVDGVNWLNENEIETWRIVKPEEFYFAGHFPNNPIFPGVLMVEAIAQTGILLVLIQEPNNKGKLPLFAGIERVRFRRIIRPGERLQIRATILTKKAQVYKIFGRIFVGEELACEAVVIGAVR